MSQDPHRRLALMPMLMSLGDFLISSNRQELSNAHPVLRAIIDIACDGTRIRTGSYVGILTSRRLVVQDHPPEVRTHSRVCFLLVVCSIAYRAGNIPGGRLLSVAQAFGIPRRLVDASIRLADLIYLESPEFQPWSTVRKIGVFTDPLVGDRSRTFISYCGLQESDLRLWSAERPRRLSSAMVHETGSASEMNYLSGILALIPRTPGMVDGDLGPPVNSRVIRDLIGGLSDEPRTAGGDE